MRNTFVNVILAASKKNKNIFIVSGDAGLGVFDDYKERSPGCFLNLGVAEQNMISFSAGMALAGYRVYVYNIIPFLLYRCYEQVRNDICYQKLPVILAGIGSGVTYAPQGMTHYSVEDLGIARTLPNLLVFSPADPCEAAAVARYCLKSTEPVYVRLPKRGEPCFHRGIIRNIRAPQVLSQGHDAAIIFHGSISQEAVAAAGMLAQRKISVKLISVPCVQPLDIAKVFEVTGTIRCVVSVEEHFLGSGIGSLLEAAFLRHKPTCMFTALGIRDEFIHAIKNTAGMREHYGISAVKIAARIEGMIKKKIHGRAR
ncbi:MAG: transketolase C-terminal domain-containing protein [Candidatus Omnitrophota bacterium]|nr:transketolase [Candidatus Omnitrophota bacterium]